MNLSPFDDIISFSLRNVKCFCKKSVVFYKFYVVLCWFQRFSQNRLLKKVFFGRFDKEISFFWMHLLFFGFCGSRFLAFQIVQNRIDPLMIVAACKENAFTAGKP